LEGWEVGRLGKLEVGSWKLEVSEVEMLGYWRKVSLIKNIQFFKVKRS
jgi:hypothetical protein